MRITLVNSAWFRSFPEFSRRQLLRNIFDLADERKIPILVQGQHWNI